ncbi:hypothetical protein EG329_005143 [Mollisiaceae sp. DMI_Dod_QoI]|nr:hypothetical protein EG329_005143 [Helotiales sp. DMI_Dod_QoI]
MAVYKYQSIDFDRPAIRLLRLFKGKFDDNIQGELFEGWINQSDGGIPYNALSYTWGSRVKVAQMIVNGSQMNITSNLLAALRHLRFEDEDRILWMNAICINQDDDRERTHQVRQMSSIYKEAEQVVIWLGEGTEESDSLMDSMRRVQEHSVKVNGDWRGLWRLWMLPRPEQIATWRKGMESMLDHPWFRRVWIVQEVANARVAIIFCGKKSVSAQIFSQIPSLIRLQPKLHCQAILDIMPGLSRKESWWGQNRNLHTLLRMFRQSQATEERDIIYALLGIASDTCQGDTFLPDYKESLQQVIQDTTSFILFHKNQDKSLLEFLQWTLPELLQNLDSLGNIVLGSTSENGQEAVVQMLLKTDGINADWKDNDNRTPLQLASRNRHETIVKLLLKHQVKVDIKDTNGRTPLSWAAESGHETIVKLLLKTRKIEVNSKDKDVQTPLWWAARAGHEAIVKLLLATDRVDVDAKNSGGWTPLCCAAGNGHETIVKLLLATNRVDVNTKDGDGRTPLWWAVRGGHETIVELLLAASQGEAVL